LADVFVDGNTRVAFVGAIVSIAAPTTTELNLGTLLQSFMTPDGLMGFEATTSEVDNTSLASTFNTKTIGRDDFSGTGLRFKKQTYGSDTVFTLLTRGTSGFIVVRRGIVETVAWTSAQNVEVYPVTCGQTKFLSPEANAIQKFEIPTPITLAPNLRAVIA